jgi:chorismate mutase
LYKSVLFAQASLESGNFTSPLFKNHKNMFAMGVARKRERFWDYIARSSEGEQAGYENVRTSLLDRLNWDEYCNIPIPTTEEAVIPYLMAVQAKGYAEDPKYIEKIIDIFNSSSYEIPDEQVENFKTPKLSPILVLLALGVAFLYYWYYIRPKK